MMKKKRSDDDDAGFLFSLLYVNTVHETVEQKPKNE